MFVQFSKQQCRYSSSELCHCHHHGTIVHQQVSLDVTTGSSLATATIPDIELADLSFTSTNPDHSPAGQSTLPPALPELRSSAQLKKLKILGASLLARGEEGEVVDPHLPRPRPTSLHPDGTLSSSGVWTASEGDREEEETSRQRRQEEEEKEPRTPMQCVVARPNSSLSAGVVSDCSTATWREESTLREGDITMEEGSIHSCDTEGYYTTFHDFDGLQEVLADVDLVIHEEREEGEEPEQSKIEEDEAERLKETAECVETEVVLRKRKGGKVPPPPQRWSSIGRESTGTVVAREDLQKEKEKDAEDADQDREVREGSAVSGDLSFDSEERRERISAKTLMAAQHIPSLCTITPPASGQNTPGNSSPPLSR